jgi:hypothetical protein
MNIDKFRNDLRSSMKMKNRSVNSIAKEFRLEQAALYRFLNSDKGLSGKYVLTLIPFVYEVTLTLPPGNAPTTSIPYQQLDSMQSAIL